MKTGDQLERVIDSFDDAIARDSYEDAFSDYQWVCTLWDNIEQNIDRQRFDRRGSSENQPYDEDTFQQAYDRFAKAHHLKRAIEAVSEDMQAKDSSLTMMNETGFGEFSVPAIGEAKSAMLDILEDDISEDIEHLDELRAEVGRRNYRSEVEEAGSAYEQGQYWKAWRLLDQADDSYHVAGDDIEHEALALRERVANEGLEHNRDVVPARISILANNQAESPEYRDKLGEIQSRLKTMNKFAAFRGEEVVEELEPGDSEDLLSRRKFGENSRKKVIESVSDIFDNLTEELEETEDSDLNRQRKIESAASKANKISRELGEDQSDNLEELQEKLDIEPIN